MQQKITVISLTKPLLKMIKEVMKAASRTLIYEDLPNLRYPVYVTDKEDGIRMHTALSEGGIVGMSRKNIPIRNMHIQQWCENAIPHLDGELIIPGAPFHKIDSFVMSAITLPRPWKYLVFDHTGFKDRNYLQRLQILKTQCENYLDLGEACWEILYPLQCGNKQKVQWEFEDAIRRGKEGIIIRSDSPYKCGRATFKEQTMLKMKQWRDSEATIIGFEPEYTNENPQIRDRTGMAKRSNHSANLKQCERLGAILVQDKKGREFSIGSGFSQKEKEIIWKNRTDYLHREVTYKKQVHGEKNKPRTPIFLRFRND